MTSEQKGRGVKEIPQMLQTNSSDFADREGGGAEGVKKSQNIVDIIYGSPLHPFLVEAHD